MTAVDLVRDLYAAAGTEAFSPLLARILASNDDVAEAIFASFADDNDWPSEAPGAHPREIWEDRTAIVVATVKRWPDRFMDLLRGNPMWTQDLSITLLLALGWVDRPAARDLLAEAVQRREAGHEYQRVFAFEGLVRLADPRLPDLLLRLVRDRSQTVRSRAVSAAIEYGDARLLPALRSIASAERTYPGTRDDAYDAIEAIVIRESLTDEPLGPRGRQLIEIRRPEVSKVIVETVQVHEGQEVFIDSHLALLRVDGEPLIVKAPHGGVVVTVGAVQGRAPRPVMFRLRSWMVT